MEKHKKAQTITINLKYQLKHGMVNFNYQMDHILYQIFRTILSNFKKHNENIDNSSVKTYVDKMENRITFKIKTGYYLELLIPETVNLLQSTENERAKNKNGDNVAHLEITEVMLFYCNIVSDYQQDSRVCYIFVQNKPFDKLLEISSRNSIILKTSNSDVQAIEVWYSDQNTQPLGIKDTINLTLVIK